VNVAVEPIARELHASLTAVQWTVSGYLLALGALALPAVRNTAMARGQRHHGTRRCSATCEAGAAIADACELRCCRCPCTHSSRG